MDFERTAHAWAALDAVAHDLLTPIETENQYQQALEAIDALMTRVNDDGDEVSPLASFLSFQIERVVAYETVILPPTQKRPEQVLAYMMEDRGLSQRGLSAAVGVDQSTISKLLKGERAFSKTQALKFGHYFGLSAELFLVS